jgi:hypothetical protein
MQVRALPTAAAVVALALSLAACNPATKAKATSTASTQAAVATETQADATSATPSTPSTPSNLSQSAGSSAAAVASPTAPASSSAAATPAPAAGGATIDACSLMTSAQASAINGVTYGAATPGHLVPGIDTCTYANTGQHADVLDIQDLEIQVISLPGCYSELEEAEGPGVKVSGVGDDAFGHEVGMDVKLGNRCIEVSGLTAAEFKDDYAPDAAMAKIIISKLS